MATSKKTSRKPSKKKTAPKKAAAKKAAPKKAAAKKPAPKKAAAKKPAPKKAAAKKAAPKKPAPKKAAAKKPAPKKAAAKKAAPKKPVSIAKLAAAQAEQSVEREPRAFIEGKITTDALAEEMAEDAVRAMTTGEDEEGDRDGERVAEFGGPYVVTSSVE